MELSIDNRESYVIPFFEPYINKERNIKIEKLEYGDYVLKYKDVIIHVIERKTWSDLYSSMINTANDGLHIKKLLKIRELTGCKVSYLIETSKKKGLFLSPDTKIGGGTKFKGVGTKQKNGTTFKHLYGLLESLYIEHDIATMYCQDKEGVVEKALSLYDRHLRHIQDGRCSIVNERVNGGALKVDPIILTKREPKTDETIIKSMWNGLLGNSPDKINFFMRYTNLKDLFFVDLKDIDFGNSGIKMLKPLRTKILNYQEEESLLHRKILIRIDGVSKLVLDTLFSQMTFKELLELEITKETIIKNKNGRSMTNLVKKIKYFLEKK